ncbi:MAG: SixA phosphatase family protein, partial [Pseudonocardiaceae bacterium]
MIRTLILLRHAKSAWPEDIADRARPLAARGVRDAPAAGHWLAEHAPTIDLAVCSTAVRAVQTWELAGAQLYPRPPVHHDESLYGASAEDLLTTIKQLASNVWTAILVGHNPGLETLLRALTGRYELIKTSTITIVTTTDGWKSSERGSWKLETLTTPRGR